MSKLNLINISNDSFVPFLKWMWLECDYDVEIIISIVEKPWKWQKEFTKYMEIVNEYE